MGGGRQPLIPKVLSGSTIASGLLSLALFCTFYLAGPVVAQTNPCSIQKGTVGTGSDFAVDSSGKDFKVSCSGVLVEDITNASLRTLFGSMTGFVEGESKIILDVRGDTSEQYNIYLESSAANTIITGTITNKSDLTDGRVVVFRSSDPATNNGIIYPLIVESYATITAKGDGSRGIYVYDEHDADINFTNYGTVETEGDIYIRPPDRNWRVRTPRGISVDAESNADVTVINESDATVTSKGLGGRGVSGYAGGAGDSRVINKGTVTTTGGSFRSTDPAETFDRRPYAVNSYAGTDTTGGGSAMAHNAQGGTITTGDPAKIANPGSDQGKAISGTGGHGLRAQTESAYAGTVEVINDGTITTYGVSAHGMSTWIDSAKTPSAASSAKGTNTGTITTHGDNSDGASLSSPFSNNAQSRVSVKNTGTVTTNGASSEGMEAWFYYSGDTARNARGTAVAENSGVITVSGDTPAIHRSPALTAGFWADTWSAVQDSGDATVKNSGTINASGDGRVGLSAVTHGTGNASIEVTGGTVTAGAGDSKKFGIGIDGYANTDSTTNDPGTDVDVMVLVSGKATAITAYGGASDDAGTEDIDETKGIGILSYSGTASGHSKVEILDGASVKAFDSDGNPGLAVLFQGGRGTLDISGSQIYGNVQFADGGNDDVMNVSGSGSIEGNVDFGAGNDVMNLDIDQYNNFEITGNVLGVQTLNKSGQGYARIGGGVTFEGSALNVDDGVLVIAGQMNAGTGTVTVKQVGKLVFEVSSVSDHGSLTAGKLQFDGADSDEAAVFAQISEDVADDQVGNLQASLGSNDLNLLTVKEIATGSSAAPVPTTEIQVQSDSAGTTTKVGTLTLAASGVGTASFDAQKTNQIAKLILPTGTPPPIKITPSADGDSYSSSVVGVGLLAVLVQYFISDDDATGEFGDYYFDRPRSAHVSLDDRGVLMIRESGNQPYRLWFRTSQVDQPKHSTGANGSEIGMTLYNNDNFYINSSVIPNFTGQVSSQSLSAEGSVYSLSSGWRNDRYFAGMRLSQGNFDADSVIGNPVVNSALVSKFKFRNSQVRFRTGANWTVDNIQFTPSATFQAGTLEQKPHVAYGQVLEADIPGYSQDYATVGLGVKMTPKDWMNFHNDSIWKPHLQFDTLRTKSQRIDALTMHQSDRLGVLDFNSAASVRPIPDVINSLSFGAKVKSSKSDRSQWKFGYAGFEVDGEYHHAAMAGYKIRF